MQLLCGHHRGPVSNDWQGLVQVVAEVMWRQAHKGKCLVRPRELKGGVQDEAHCSAEEREGVSNCCKDTLKASGQEAERQGADMQANWVGVTKQGGSAQV